MFSSLSNFLQLCAVMFPGRSRAWVEVGVEWAQQGFYPEAEPITMKALSGLGVASLGFLS